MKKRWLCAFMALLLTAGALCGCSAAPAEDEGEIIDLGGIEEMEIPLAGSPAISYVISPVASGTATEKNSSAVIDYSNTKDGYIMIKWTGGSTSSKLKVQVKGPGKETYTYNLRSDGQYETFPLSDGNGKYQFTVNKQVSGTKYSLVLAASATVQLTDEFAPFIRPNQYVNFTEDSAAVAKAAELIADAGVTDNLEKVGVIYEWVVTNLTYDTERANQVKSGSLVGYLPDVDDVMAAKKGICFDYAALMAAMLRSQNVPIKLVVGFTGQTYHAWVNVWSETEGWVEGMIYFNGEIWNLMDPTYASSGKQSKKIMDYIGNSSNYQEKYLY